MRRILFGTLALAAAAGPAAAQHRGGGGGGHVGGAHMAAPSGGAHVGGAHVAGYRPAGNFNTVHPAPVYRSPGVGLYAGGLYGGYGGGLYGGGLGLRGGYGYGSGLYGGGLYGGYGGGYGSYSVAPPAGGGLVVLPPPFDPSTAPAVSGVLPATLVIQFPAAAKVWLDGVEVPGDPEVSWTLTSKDLNPNETATFKVRGRWEAGGKTFEAVREIPLGPGARSRLVVVSGNEVTE